MFGLKNEPPEIVEQVETVVCSLVYTCEGDLYA